MKRRYSRDQTAAFSGTAATSAASWAGSAFAADSASGLTGGLRLAKDEVMGRGTFLFAGLGLGGAT